MINNTAVCARRHTYGHGHTYAHGHTLALIHIVLVGMLCVHVKLLIDNNGILKQLVIIIY